MSELSTLPNIGKSIEEKLNAAEIFSAGQLKELGSKDAFIRIRLKDPDACINMLCAIEGAIEGVRWHHLTDEKKAELQAFYSTL